MKLCMPFGVATAAERSSLLAFYPRVEGWQRQPARRLRTRDRPPRTTTRKQPWMDGTTTTKRPWMDETTTTKRPWMDETTTTKLPWMDETVVPCSRTVAQVFIEQLMSGASTERKQRVYTTSPDASSSPRSA